MPSGELVFLGHPGIPVVLFIEFLIRLTTGHEGNVGQRQAIALMGFILL